MCGVLNTIYFFVLCFNQKAHNDNMSVESFLQHKESAQEE